jgi:hypothetical protein
VSVILRRIGILAVTYGLIFAAALRCDGDGPQSDMTPRVSEKAVWKPGDYQLNEIKGHCWQKDLPDRLACFLEEMRLAGASPEALAFTLSLGSDVGYMTHFRAGGPVDIAYVNYPFDKDRLYRYGVYLVNSNPPLLDLEAPVLLNEIAEDAAARGLIPSGSGGSALSRMPTMDIPAARLLVNGGVELVMGYWTRLSAGPSILFVRLRFDQKGNFLSAGAQNVASFYGPSIDESNAPHDYKEGNFFLLNSTVVAGDSVSATPGDSAVVREVAHGLAGGSFCAGPCFGTVMWVFEAVGKGETNIVFSTGNESNTQGMIVQSSEYRVHVD